MTDTKKPATASKTTGAGTARTTAKPADTTTAKPVSSDPQVRTAAETVDPALAPPKAETVEIVAPGGAESQADADPATAAARAAAQVAQASATESGAVDAQAAAIAGRARREALEAQKQNGGPEAGGVVPVGGIVRQIEDGAVTDRRAGAAADRSLAGENLPALRRNEPDPRQGVTTGELTNPGVRDGEDSVQVTFLTGYHLYNRGEKASFTKAEAERLRGLGVAE